MSRPSPPAEPSHSVGPAGADLHSGPSSAEARLGRTLTVALIGNPNTGKSTLFNALTGGHAHVGNYAGVTVEKKIGRWKCGAAAVRLVDLPGTYSLAPRSRDEMLSVNVLLGHQPDVGRPDAVLCVLDASNLERNLYLASQVIDCGLPTVLILNMWDVAEARGERLDVAELERRLGVPVVVTEAHRRRGLAEIQSALERAVASGPPAPLALFPTVFAEEQARLAKQFEEWNLPIPEEYLRARLLLDVGGYLEAHLARGRGHELGAVLVEARKRLAEGGCRVPAAEPRLRYQWARRTLHGIHELPGTRPASRTDRIDRWLTHPFAGMGVFLAVMFLVFQAINVWAHPLMEVCTAGQNALASATARWLPPGPLRSLLTDGVIAGVGGVLVFVPQIALLFLFIALLEDSGYMARAAFLMDRLMVRVGLSGKSFVPLMSSFACAIPGVMATRVIENPRDRLTTILVAPLMSCSARLPVYVLMIETFVPDQHWLGGWVSLHTLVMLAMLSLGALVAVPVAWLLKSTLLRGETPPFVMELPSYKLPSAWIVLRRVKEQVGAFVMRAGTLIFTTSVLVWLAGYFPGDHAPADNLLAQIETLAGKQQAELDRREELLVSADATGRDALPESDRAELAALDQALQPLDDLRAEHNRLASTLLEGSLLGRMGHAVEPLVRPLGWDWRLGIGAIASFPAREVIVSTLGTIFSLGGDVSETSTELRGALARAVRKDGTPLFTVPVALSVMVFFALCAQCASTLMVIRRETNSWGWPAFTFAYMTALAWLGAFATYQIGSRL